MKDDQLTLRLAADVAAALEREAKGRGVAKSQVVREAIRAYLVDSPAAQSADAWSRVAPLIGSAELDRKAASRDQLARRLRAHNWRS